MAMHQVPPMADMLSQTLGSIYLSMPFVTKSMPPSVFPSFVRTLLISPFISSAFINQTSIGRKQDIKPVSKAMTLVRQRRHHPPLKLLLPPSPPQLLRPPPPLSLPSPRPNSPGKLSDLEKLAVIGHGSGGTVYKVRHRRSCTVFALKVVRLGCEEAVAALREAEILRRADSPEVVRCYGVLEGEEMDGALAEDGTLCLVLEYMDAGSVQDLLRRCRRLPEPAISGIGRRVLEGLAYLHGMGIVHRDIKPSNLLINTLGEVKIADFGVSREVVEAGEDSDAGTFAYMSPERFDPNKCGDDCDGFAGDIWALGVAMLECLVGHYPLIPAGQRPDWSSLVWTVCFGGEPEMPDGASPEFCSFIGRCLERDWIRRPRAKELLEHPFITNFQSMKEFVVSLKLLGLLSILINL